MGQTLGQRNLELTDRVKALEQTIEQKDTDYAIQQRELKDTQSKLQILKRALETRFDELALNGSLHTGILFELARLQDQSANLAAQLSQERKASKLLEVRDPTHGLASVLETHHSSGRLNGSKRRLKQRRLRKG